MTSSRSPAEISCTGTRTPVLECTQVSATTRVFGVTASSSRFVMSATVAAAGSSYRSTRVISAPVRSSRSRSASSVEKKSWVVVRTSSPSRRVSPPYIVAMPIVVLSVSAYCDGSPPANAAAASRTACSLAGPESSASSVSRPSRSR